jgi:3-phosphoinositide dependent protein kinase-1
MAALAKTQTSETPAETGKKMKTDVSDFFFGKQLGEGAYAKVFHARHKRYGDKEFAAKVMDIKFITKHDKSTAVKMECTLLQKLAHPNIVRLYFAFTSSECLFMMTELCTGGELRELIDVYKHKSGVIDVAMSKTVVRFYMAEMLAGIQYLHDQGILHRDLKPENILLSSTGHIKLVDFGTALDLNSRQSKVAFVGTAEYVSPEVLKDEPVGKGSDLWAVGCILFHMLVGRPPFRGESEYLTFQEIGDFSPETFAFPAQIDSEGKDLFLSLLRPDPDSRLGAGLPESDCGYPSLKMHPFFTDNDASFSWESLIQQTPPPLAAPLPMPAPKKDGANLDFGLLDFEEELNDGDEIRESQKSIAIIAEASSLMENIFVTHHSTVDDKWKDFVFAGEHIVYSGSLWKRRFFSMKRRFFILTIGGLKPRFIYFDEENMEFKGEIPFSSTLNCDVINARKLDIITPDRTYHLSDEKGHAHRWVAAIDYVMRKCDMLGRDSTSSLNSV